VSGRPLAEAPLGSPETTFVVVEWADDGETSRERPIAPLHRHLGEEEAWVVLEGRLGFRVGDAELEAGPGEAVLAPRGAAHTYWNAGAGRARYVLVMGPRTAALVAAIHEPGRLDRTSLASLFRDHESELLPAGEGVPWPG
jgi:mannose-6-phosphate isomerase-like protein (cupin superfamily)